MFDDNEDLGAVYSGQALNKTVNLLVNMKNINSLAKKTTEF